MKKTFLSVVLTFIFLLIGTSALAADYMFNSTINETGNTLIVNLNVSESVQGNYFIINAYKENKMVANKLVKADFSTNTLVINCSEKPDAVKVNIWKSLVNVKPVIDSVKYTSSESSGVQIFTPVDGFPEDIPTHTVVGVVTTNEKTSISSYSFMDKDYIQIQTSEGSYTTLYAPDIDSDYYLGKLVTVTYTDDTSKNAVLKSINASEDNKTAVIDAPENIVLDYGSKYTSALQITDNTIDGALSVYDEEVDLTNTEYKLDRATIIYNGKYLRAESIYDIRPPFGKLELLDNDGDNEYEIIFITSYETRVVDSIYNNNTTIGCKIGSKIELEDHLKGKDGYKYSIELDGEEIAITDLKEYDVISVAASKDHKIVKILVSRNVVKGSVEAIDMSSNAALRTIYTIAGKEYKLSYLEDPDDYPELNVTTEGKFYVDVFGRIAMFKALSVFETGNLAFIQDFGEFASFGQTEYEIELLNKDGSVVIYSLADKVTVKTNTSSGVKTDKADVAATINTLVRATNNSLNYANRIITYKVNSANKITAITFADNNEGGKGLSIATGSASDEYDASVSSLKYGVTEETIIFYLPVYANKNDYMVTDISILKDGGEYNTAYLGIDDDFNASVVIITDDSISIADGSSLAVVTGSSIVTNEDGDAVIQVSFLQDGEAKTLTVDSEADINIVDANPFVRGALFEYALNIHGEIDDADFEGCSGSIAFSPEMVKKYTTKDTNSYLDGIQLLFNTKKADEPMDFQYIAGYVVGKQDNILTLSSSINSVLGDRTYIPDSANIYMIDCRKANIPCSTGTINEIYPIETYSENDTILTKDGKDTYVLIKYLKGEIVDVISYIGFAPSSYGELQFSPENIPILGTTAFISRFGYYEAYGEQNFEIELMNTDGSLVVYQLNDNISVTYNNSENVSMSNYDVAEIIASLTSDSPSSENYAKRLISYSANANGEIYAINFSVEGINGGLSYYSSYYDSYKYDEKTKTVGPFGITDKTIILYLPFDEWVGPMRDEYRILNITQLKDGAKYSASYLDIDKNGNAGIIIITSQYTSLADNQSLSVVTGSSIVTNDEGDSTIKVSFLQDGEAKTLTVDSEAVINTVDANRFVRGALFEYALNLEGEIEDADFNGDEGSIAYSPAMVQYAAKTGDVFRTKKADEPKDFQYIAGYVVTKSGSTLGLATSPFAQSGSKVSIPDSANIYVMDVTKSKITPVVASIGDVTKVLIYTEDDVDYLEEDEDTYVIIKYVDKTIVDVIAYKGLNFVDFE